MAKKITIRIILGILAMMLLVPLAMPDSAFARKPKPKDFVSVVAACKQLKQDIDEAEENGGDEGELRDKKELYETLDCDFVLAIPRDIGQKDVGDKDPDVGVAPEDDGCTWKNLWCKLTPVVEVAQTIASPVLGPTNPPPDPLPPLDPRPEPPDPLPPAPVPLSELSGEGSGDPDSSGSSDIDALAKNNAPPAGDHLKGYNCEVVSVGAWVCRKDGAPPLLCDTHGQCTECDWCGGKITNPNPIWGLPKSPTNAGVAQEQTQSLKPQSLEPAPQQHNEENVASPSEVQGEVSSDQPSSGEETESLVDPGVESSGEGTESLVDPGVEMSEGSTTENIR